MININLLPPEIKEDIEQTKKNSKTLSLVRRTLMMSLLIITLIYGFHVFFGLEETDAMQNAVAKEKLTHNYGNLENESKKLADRVDAIAKIEKSINIWSGTLEEIGKITPSGVFLTNFKYDTTNKGARGQLVGRADSQELVAAFRNSLEQSPKFQYVDIDVSQVQTDPTTKIEGQVFTISFSLEKGALK